MCASVTQDGTALNQVIALQAFIDGALCYYSVPPEVGDCDSDKFTTLLSGLLVASSAMLAELTGEKGKLRKIETTGCKLSVKEKYYSDGGGGADRKPVRVTAAILTDNELPDPLCEVVLNDVLGVLVKRVKQVRWTGEDLTKILTPQITRVVMKQFRTRTLVPGLSALGR
jgi:hypothetical protein